jgi:hypothetical protein
MPATWHPYQEVSCRTHSHAEEVPLNVSGCASETGFESRTSGLPGDYVRARHRIHSLTRPHPETSERAWQWLLAWRRQVQDRTRRKLPAPWIFSTPAGQVELEWHLSERHVILTVPKGDEERFEYARAIGPDGQEQWEEGEVDIADVADLLVWVVA